MEQRRLRAVMVSMSHWDRAWYVPFQEFRWALVELLDQVLHLLDHRPGFQAFMLDGQTIPIEDYLEFRPERREDVRRQVAAGRLLVGPWYVLPDEYLASPEALVRNLLIGTRLARQLGGEPMLHGYNPDSFGHVGQLPQILRGFGIETALFWRGFGAEGERIPNEFWWEAPDGSRVLASFLRFGYGNASQLGYPARWGDVSYLRFDPELAVRQAVEVLEGLAPHAPAGVVLLLNGTDHTRPQAEIPDVVRRLRELGYDVRHGGLHEYFDAVRAAAPELPVLRGEFNRGRFSPILQGVYSSRMPIKQRNWEVQRLLERAAEPAATMAWLAGAEYPAAALEVAWKWLIRNHPHDDICGCSVDQVHREDLYRFDQAEQIARIVERESLRAVLERIALTRSSPAVAVWNPSLYPRSEVAVLSVPFADRAKVGALVAVGPDGSRHSVQVLAVREGYLAEPRRTARRTLVGLAVEVEVPACGYAVYHLEPLEPPSPPAHDDQAVRVTGEREMQNGHLRVSIERDGRIFLEDRGSGHRYGPLHLLEDTEDAGDEYDYSPAPHSTTLWSAGSPVAVRWLEEGPLRATAELRWEWRLPASLAPDRQGRSQEWVGCPVTTRVSLRRGQRRLEFVTELENRAEDHRLRVHFETGIPADRVLVDGHFDVLRRPARPDPQPEWHQPPVPTGLARRFVAVERGGGLAVMTRGLPEYEAVPAPAGLSLAITLLRAVGWLSRDDLLTRRSGAGPSIPTPEAQLAGRHRFEYAVQVFGDLEELLVAAEEYHNPLVAWRADTRAGLLAEELQPGYPQHGALNEQVRDMPARRSWLQVDPAAIGVSALKRSEDGSAVVLRLWNPFDGSRQAVVTPGFAVREAWKARLDETPVEPVRVDAGRIKLQIGSREVVTLRLVPGS
ncbi:MAG: glycoside hydrolase family 38 C-terminal domain-containing protein [Bacillota bacterium]